MRQRIASRIAPCEHYHINPRYIPAYVNLADLYRVQKRDDEGKLLLEETIVQYPDNSSLYHSYGLLLVRHKQIEDALAALKHAVDLEPTNTRYCYIYAVALHSVGDTKGAIEMLKKAHDNFPADREVLIALITYHQQMGDTSSSKHYTEILLQLAPWDTRVRSLLQQLDP